jgi:hypothetical protein
LVVACLQDAHAFEFLDVADRAWPFVQEHLVSALPGERLRTLGLEGYWLHDARQHWAVRMARAGTPFEPIARQLGHRDVGMVAKVYGRFKPDTEKRDRWERIATTPDGEKWTTSGSTGGASGGARSYPRGSRAMRPLASESSPACEARGKAAPRPGAALCGHKTDTPSSMAASTSYSA